MPTEKSITIKSVSTDQYVTIGKKRRVQQLFNDNNKQAKITKDPTMPYGLHYSTNK